MTPMIDILLVLIVIFMVITVGSDGTICLNPEPSSSPILRNAWYMSFGPRPLTSSLLEAKKIWSFGKPPQSSISPTAPD